MAEAQSIHQAEDMLHEEDFKLLSKAVDIQDEEGRPQDEEVRRHLALVSISGQSRNDTSSNRGTASLHDVRNAPLFTNRVKNELMWLIGQDDQGEGDGGDSNGDRDDDDNPIFPTYGHLGLRLATYKDGVETVEAEREENLVYANINAPFSTFICGSQGNGKSHTLSCLLETALIDDGYLGPNPNPLAGVVFHYDKHSGQAAAQICEAAYLASHGVEVEVFVSPTNLPKMEQRYQLPGIPADKQPKVRPLLLRDSQINIANMRSLMNLDAKDGKVPLYMALVDTVLRDMAKQPRTAPGIDYCKFRSDIDNLKLSDTQKEHLNQRLKLLESFLHTTASRDFKKRAGHGFKPKAGSLIIVDLSCPFMVESDACMFFSICLSLFIGSRNNHGLVVAVDEAHKFLTGTDEAKGFTEELIRAIREQRHLATRVIIATQEPTLSTALLDLCNITIVHRFQSQAWYNTLKNHLAALNTKNEGDVFERIVDLECGEALVFCPTAYRDCEEEEDGRLKPLRVKSENFKMRVRKRVTEDGGKSIMAAKK